MFFNVFQGAKEKVSPFYSLSTHNTLGYYSTLKSLRTRFYPFTHLGRLSLSHFFLFRWLENIRVEYLNTNRRHLSIGIDFYFSSSFFDSWIFDIVRVSVQTMIIIRGTSEKKKWRGEDDERKGKTFSLFSFYMPRAHEHTHTQHTTRAFILGVKVARAFPFFFFFQFQEKTKIIPYLFINASLVSTDYADQIFSNFPRATYRRWRSEILNFWGLLICFFSQLIGNSAESWSAISTILISTMCISLNMLQTSCKFGREVGVEDDCVHEALWERERERREGTARTLQRYSRPSHWPLEPSQTTQWPIFLSLFCLSCSAAAVVVARIYLKPNGKLGAAI